MSDHRGPVTGRSLVVRITRAALEGCEQCGGLGEYEEHNEFGDDSQYQCWCCEDEFVVPQAEDLAAHVAALPTSAKVTREKHLRAVLRAAPGEAFDVVEDANIASRWTPSSGGTDMARLSLEGRSIAEVVEVVGPAWEWTVFDSLGTLADGEAETQAGAMAAADAALVAAGFLLLPGDVDHG